MGRCRGDQVIGETHGAEVAGEGLRRAGSVQPHSTETTVRGLRFPSCLSALATTLSSSSSFHLIVVELVDGLDVGLLRSASINPKENPKSG